MSDTTQPQRWISNGMQAVSLLLSVGAGCLAGYVTTRTDMAEWEGKVSQHELRLNAIDRLMDQQHKEVLDYQNEMRAAVAHAVDLLTDLRLQVAKGRHG